MTKLGRLVKDGKIKRLEDIYLFAMPIKVGLPRRVVNISILQFIAVVVNTLCVLVSKMTVAFHSSLYV